MRGWGGYASKTTVSPAASLVPPEVALGSRTWVIGPGTQGQLRTTAVEVPAGVRALPSCDLRGHQGGETGAPI